MSIRLICPGCRKQLAVPDTTAGQMGRCPACNTLFNVPADAKPTVESIMPPPPPRRTAVAKPIPAPVIRDEAPVTGLSLIQKLVLGVVALGAVAVGGYFGVRSLSPKEASNEIVADAGKAAAPVREPEPSKSVPGKSDPVPPPPSKTKPHDEEAVEEDIGTPAVPTRPSSKPPKETKPETPPVVVQEPSKEPTPKNDPSAKTEAVATKPPAKEPTPETTTEPSAPADDYRPGGASIYTRLLKSTAMIIRPHGDGRASRGSGSLVHRGQRLVLTNYHVVGDASEVYVTFPLYENGKLITESKQYMRQFEEKFIKAKVVRVLKGQDLALVQLEKLPAGTPVVRLAPKSAQPGDSVHSIGNPGASDAAWLYTKGEVRQVSHKTWQARGAGNEVLPFDAEVLETTSPTNPGDSGGPLVNERCQLVGVTQGADSRARSVSIFIDISEVRKILKEQGVTGETGGGESTPTAGPRTATVAELAKKLQSADARVRADAAAQLAERGGDAKAALHDLIAALADGEKSVRKQAGNALVQIGTLERGEVETGDLPGLRAGLRDDLATAELHRWTIEALLLLGTQARLAATELGKAVRGEDKETRQAALAALDKLGAAARKAAPDVAELLKNDDRFLSARAAMVLLKMDDTLATDESKAAAGVLITVQRPQAAEDLENKQLAALLTEAGKALTRVGKPAVPAVRKALMTTFKGGNRATGEDLFNAIARLAMIRILENMGPSIFSNELDRDLITLGKSDPAVAVREGAKQARAKLKPEK
jgi:S1-C subfamily serine protease